MTQNNRKPTRWGAAIAVALIAAAASAAPNAEPTKADPKTYLSVSAHYGDGGSSKASGQWDEATVEFDNGSAVIVAIGQQMNPRMRVEIEGSWRSNNINMFTQDFYAVPGPANGATLGGRTEYGDVKALTLMVNALLTAPSGRLQPYVGVGAGVAHVDSTVRWENNKYYPNDPVTASTVEMAWQILAGVEYALAENLSAKLGYRYFATGDIEVRGREMDYSVQGIEAGIRVTF